MSTEVEDAANVQDVAHRQKREGFVLLMAVATDVKWTGVRAVRSVEICAVHMEGARDVVLMDVRVVPRLEVSVSLMVVASDVPLKVVRAVRSVWVYVKLTVVDVNAW
jgi:hypothetical protein